jgi:GcrA cell cycle regulator
MAKEKKAVSLFERQASPFRTCQWPFGDPGDNDFHFCGKNTHETFSYCAEHVAMAYREPEPRRSAPVSPRRHAA